jgi:hypothetical protein
MNARIDTLLGKMRLLEHELAQEAKNGGAELCYRVHQKTVHFTDEAKAEHRKLRLGLRSYLVNSRFLVLVTSPMIWVCAIPIVLTDLVGTLYQAICFPIYGIPRVRRSDYLAFDRHRLTYLNFVEKLNCEYCAYVNGILAYFTEIAGRTEQHWCPIKHAGCVKCAHSRYKRFVEFGAAEQYRRHSEEVRRSFGDLEPAPSGKDQP